MGLTESAELEGRVRRENIGEMRSFYFMSPHSVVSKNPSFDLIGPKFGNTGKFTPSDHNGHGITFHIGIFLSK